MQIFLDTAETDEIRARTAAGLVDGITTNPSLIARSGAGILERIGEICAIVPGPVSAEVVATETAGMLAEADTLRRIAGNVVIKLPLTPAGLEACKALSEQNVPTNVTLCFSVNQALLAAKAGATFISPFVGRLEDAGGDGIGLLEGIRDVYDRFGFETSILAASLRSPLHVEQAALAGADAATLPPKVFDQLIRHPQTDQGLQAFLADWAGSGRAGLS